MTKFKVLHHTAGRFPQGAIVTQKEIEDAGNDLEAWIESKAIVEIPPPQLKTEHSATKKGDPKPPAAK